MIFDAHAYCLPPLRESGGFGAAETLRRHLQQAVAVHHQPVWRVRDRKLQESSELIDPSRWSSLDDLRQADFRVASHGRFEWMIEGEAHAKQYFPPSVTDMSYSPDKLVAEMDYAGVDKALLHRTPYLGIGNDFVSSCVHQYPKRLKGLAHVEEWLVESNPEAAVRAVEAAVNTQGLSGLQFLPPQMDLYGQTGPWDAAGFQTFWDGVVGLDIPVFFSLKWRQDPKAQSYVNELRTLIRWMDRYPDTDVVLTHGLSWHLFIDGDKLTLPDDVWAPFANPRLHLQLLLPIALGATWDYPMPQVKPAMEECVRRIGARRLMWGTDMPIVMRYWTYRQNIDFIRLYWSFLGTKEMDDILGGTIARLLGNGQSE